MRIVDTATTRRHLAFPALIEALRQMFASGCEMPTRHTHDISGAGTLLLMPAWRAGARLGIKTVSIFPGNGARGLPGLHSIYLLLDATTGVPLAQLDGNEITSRRTVATAALAASYLARTDARRLLIVGSGRVASLIAPAMRAVRPIDEVVVWNHRVASARALVDALAGDGIAARVAGESEQDLAEAVAQADIVSCATLSTAALIRGAWLAPGAHLDLIGSFTPAMREADADCFARSRVFVDVREALVKSGDLLQAISAGSFSEAHLQGELAQLCRGHSVGRGEREITLFKSVGSALADLAAAELVFGALEAESLS